MNPYLDAFREAAPAAALARRIGALAVRLPEARTTFRIMEVCGSHTMAIARYALRDLLPARLELISGPGCPVCVTDPGYLDAAIALARDGARIYTFGDLLRAPGSAGSLADARAAGATVEVCVSPLAAVEAARAEPAREVIFLAVGFETTVAPILAAAAAAERSGLRNFSLLTAFKRIPPALEALAADPALAIDAFLLPAHVSAIIGAAAYEPFVRAHRRPCAIAGFEPLDILDGIESLLQQAVNGVARVDNRYSRVVRSEGNPRAQRLIAEWLEPADAAWRGLGVIPESGWRLRREKERFDAARRFGLEVRAGRSHPACRCGDVLKGLIRPEQCALFGRVCRPEQPVGPCMVSSEGSCAAALRYRPAAASGTRSP